VRQRLHSVHVKVTGVCLCASRRMLCKEAAVRQTVWAGAMVKIEVGSSGRRRVRQEAGEEEGENRVAMVVVVERGAKPAFIGREAGRRERRRCAAWRRRPVAMPARRHGSTHAPPARRPPADRGR